MSQPTLPKLIFIICIVVGLLSLAGVITLIAVWQTKLTPFRDYAVVVDAGSTHSKIFLYNWPADKSDGLGLTSRVAQVKSCSVPGDAITSVTEPIQTNIKDYFEAAMINCTGDIPLTRKARALIYLGGTAGLRLFEMRNASYTNELLNGTRDYFRTLGLHFTAPQEQVRIISGSEEGLSGWISTNILVGELFKNNKPLETYGVSDMGGASTQMSFVSSNATNDRFDMNLFNTEYNIYSHSYLCYGTEQLRLIYLGQLVNKANGSAEIDEPCLQSGYIQTLNYSSIFDTPCARDRFAPLPDLNTSSTYTFIGTGDYDECANAVQERLNTSYCNTTSCSFDNVYQPKPIAPSLKFIAMSAWYTTFNNLAPNVSLPKNPDGNYDFDTVNLTQIKRALAAICNQSWADVPNPDRYRPFLCFNSMYHWTLYEYGYSMNDTNLKNFHIVKSINSNDIGWSLGYMINQTNYLTPEQRPARLLTQNEFGGLLTLCLLLLILSIIVAIVTKHRYRNPFQSI